MRAAVERRRDAGVRADDLDIELCVSAGYKDLVARAACCERRKRMRERDFAGRGQARGHAHHIRLLDAAVYGLLGKCLGEGLCTHRAHQVRVEYHDVPILPGQLHQCVTEDRTHFHGVVAELFF